MKSKTISISCIGGSVGLAWEHSIIARQRKNKIYTTVALDEQIEKWSAEGSNLFEYLADLLSESSLEDELHIDYECLNESCVTVNGLDGWKKNYIIFCYGRNEEKQCSYGWFFDGLSENELKKIFINFKNINEIKDFILEIDKILTNLNDINFIQKELIKYGKLRKFHYYPDTLIELAEIFNINRNNNIYRELKKKVSKLYNKYFSKIPDFLKTEKIRLKKFENHANKAKFNEGAKWYNEAVKVAIKRYIKSYYAQHKDFPGGEHRVKDIIFTTFPKGTIKKTEVERMVSFPYTKKQIKQQRKDKKIEAQMEPYRKFAKLCKFDISSHFPKSSAGAIGRGMASANLFEKIVKFAYEYYKKNNKMPKGKHNIIGANQNIIVVEFPSKFTLH